MATVKIFAPQLSGTAGLTLWLRKESDASVVNAGGDALTESGTSGWFAATVTESWAETLSATVIDSGGLIPQSGWLSVGSLIVADSRVDTTAPDNASITAIKAKTDNLPADPADQSAVEAAITSATSGLATALDISGLNNLSASEVNAEMLDVLATDVFDELSAVPGASATIVDKLTWLFMWARNKATETALERKLFADDNVTVVSTESVTDDNITFTKTKAI